MNEYKLYKLDEKLFGTKKFVSFVQSSGELEEMECRLNEKINDIISYLGVEYNEPKPSKLIPKENPDSDTLPVTINTPFGKLTASAKKDQYDEVTKWIKELNSQSINVTIEREKNG